MECHSLSIHELLSTLLKIDPTGIAGGGSRDRPRCSSAGRRAGAAPGKRREHEQGCGLSKNSQKRPERQVVVLNQVLQGQHRCHLQKSARYLPSPAWSVQ